MEKMTVREFLTKCEEDVDVCTDVIDHGEVAYCPVILLTDDGEKEWSDILDLNVDVNYRWNVAVVECPTEELDDRAWDFFMSIAGYCSDSNWEKWFKCE